MRKLLLCVFFAFVMVANSKTTYIPTYRSYMQIVDGRDTVFTESNLDTLLLADTGGMFVLRIDHEDMTREKVKRIKRAKLSSGLMTFAAVTGGVSTAFSDNSLEYLVRSTKTRIASTLADIYATNAKEEQRLEINLWIDNTTDGELMISDMERGFTWWVLPRQSICMKLNNPEASRLRISNPQSSNVRYVTALVGSKVTKYEIELETEEYWYSPVFMPDKPHDSFSLLHYIRIGKSDYNEEKISKEDFRIIKNSLKK